MNERLIQQILYARIGQGRQYTVPNVYLFGENESDLVTLTKAGYFDEYEIKISRADFQADRKKARAAQYVHRSPWVGYPGRIGGTIDGHGVEVTWIRKRTPYPNRFWYAVPEGLVTAEEVPDYAGLVYIRENRTHHVERKAPKLHDDKATEAQIQKMLRAAYYRYTDRWAWNR